MSKVMTSDAITTEARAKFQELLGGKADNPQDFTEAKEIVRNELFSGMQYSNADILSFARVCREFAPKTEVIRQQRSKGHHLPKTMAMHLDPASLTPFPEPPELNGTKPYTFTKLIAETAKDVGWLPAMEWLKSLAIHMGFTPDAASYAVRSLKTQANITTQAGEVLAVDFPDPIEMKIRSLEQQIQELRQSRK